MLAPVPASLLDHGRFACRRCACHRPGALPRKKKSSGLPAPKRKHRLPPLSLSQRGLAGSTMIWPGMAAGSSGPRYVNCT